MITATPHYWQGLTCFTLIDREVGPRTYLGNSHDGVWFLAQDSLRPHDGPGNDPENDTELQVRICDPVYDEYPGDF